MAVFAGRGPCFALLLSALLLAAPGAAQELRLPATERTLENGLKVLVLEDHSAPCAALYIAWRVGSRNERPGITGLAHFFEHMMFSGGERFGSGRFDPVMEAAGGANNAYTTNDVTVYQDWFPAAQLPLILEMEADRMRALRLTPSLVELERGVVASERRLSMEEPAEAMREQLWAAAFTAHPYQWSVLGWMTDIRHWRQQDLEEFFQLHYAPQNAVLVLVGDVQTAQALTLIEERLGKLPRGPERQPLHTTEPPQRGERRVVLEEPAAALPEVMAAWHVPESLHQDGPALQVLERILLSGASSRLNRLLVEEAGLCLEVGGGLPGYTLDPSLFSVELVLREEADPAEAETKLYQALDQLRDEGPGKEELAKAVSGLRAELVRQMATINGRAELLATAEVFLGGWARVNTRLAALEAVTPADLQRVLTRYFTPRNRTVVTLAMEHTGTGEPEADPDAASLAPRPDQAAPARPELPPVPALRGAPVRLPAHSLYTLPNGLHVLLVPDAEVPLVSFQVRVAGGSNEDPAGGEGADRLLAGLLLRGAGQRDAVSFRQAVEQVGGEIEGGADAAWLSCSADFLARDARLGLELLRDVLRSPRLDAEQFELERGLAVDDAVARRDDLGAVLADYWRAWTFAGGPWARPPGGDEHTLAGLTREAVLAQAKRQLTPARTWLVVSGDFDAASMRAWIEAGFGDWKVEGGAAPAPVAQGPRARNEATPRVLLVNAPEALQTYFGFGGPTLPRQDPDFPARQLANTVFGGRFTSRLNQALRVESGLTYGAYSALDDERGGQMFASSHTARDTSVQALELARATYQKLREGGITQAELDSARNYVKGQFALDNVETAAQAAQVLLDLAWRGLPTDDVDGYFARLDALTLEQVNQVIKRRFPPVAALDWVVIGRAELLRPVLAKFGQVTQVELADPGYGPGFLSHPAPGRGEEQGEDEERPAPR